MYRNRVLFIDPDTDFDFEYGYRASYESDSSVGAFPDLHPMMMPTNLAGVEHRQVAGFD